MLFFQSKTYVDHKGKFLKVANIIRSKYVVVAKYFSKDSENEKMLVRTLGHARICSVYQDLHCNVTRCTALSILRPKQGERIKM